MEQGKPGLTAIRAQGAVPDEYLTIGQLADRLSVKPKTIRNKMASGTFRKGHHFYSPRGLGPRFKWSAILEWLEKSGEGGKTSGTDSAGIPMARGYTLGHPEA
jgi:hypothetical protein